MKIIQLAPSIFYGDAVGNDVLVIYDIIRSMGFQTKIYAENIDPKLNREYIFNYSAIPSMAYDDILIYHMSIGTRLSYMFEKFRCRKILIYHNITPPEYFQEYSNSRHLFAFTNKGIEQIKYLYDKFDYCLVDSEFNRNDLLSYGYRCPIDVLPIMIPFSDYAQNPSEAVIQRYNDNITNLLFVGRVAPNKKQEDIIATFYYYQKYYNQQSRLLLVGSWLHMEAYYERLREYIRLLQLENVFFTGHVKFDEILGYYKTADVFLSMSEHEGFGVPLVEAMFFDVPVVAYACTAVPFTLGDAGMLFKEKNHLLVAGLVNMLLTNPNLYAQVIEKQHARLKNYTSEIVREQFVTYLTRFMKNSK